MKKSQNPRKEPEIVNSGEKVPSRREEPKQIARSPDPRRGIEMGPTESRG